MKESGFSNIQAGSDDQRGGFEAPAAFRAVNWVTVKHDDIDFTTCRAHQL